MALDTEAKRWSMLQVANGPSSYSHVINPTGSNFDSEIERVTLLKHYGGLTVGDSTAPVLSLATGIKTGETTGSGTATTDEGNGTLYFWASTSASETAADIVTNGSSQAVSATGVQNVTFTGLTASTDYYAHYVHDDAATNRSNVVSSTPAFTTDAAAVTDERPAGGFWLEYELEYARRAKANAKREEEEEKAKRIKDKLLREIALAERQLEAKEARDIELSMITKLAIEHKAQLEEELADNVIQAANRAIMQHNYSAMEALERLLNREREEEIFLMQAARILLNA